MSPSLCSCRRSRLQGGRPCSVRMKPSARSSKTRLSTFSTGNKALNFPILPIPTAGRETANGRSWRVTQMHWSSSLQWLQELPRKKQSKLCVFPWFHPRIKDVNHFRQISPQVYKQNWLWKYDTTKNRMHTYIHIQIGYIHTHFFCCLFCLFLKALYGLYGRQPHHDPPVNTAAALVPRELQSSVINCSTICIWLAHLHSGY